MVFKKLLSTKKKLLYSDLTVLKCSSEARIWLENMRNYFIILGYKQHLINGRNNSQKCSEEWKVDEEFMKKILKDHLHLSYHKYIADDSSVFDILKELQNRLEPKIDSSLSRYSNDDYISYSRLDHELSYHLNKIYFNILIDA